MKEMSLDNNPAKEKKLYTRKTKRVLFYCVIMGLPILQFCIFYIYVNINSIALAFKLYSSTNDGIVSIFAGMTNFKTAFEMLMSSGRMFRNSLLLYVCNLFFGMSLALLFSYYLSKKYPASGLFKVVLFMPQIISSVVLGILFKYISTDVYSTIMYKFTQQNVVGLLDNPNTRLATIIFYNIWVSFGVNVLLFTGSMSGINESIIESAQLDGASVMQEFFHITIPMIFPTFTTFIVVGLAQIFTNQLHLYTFFGENAGDLSTMGYFMFVQAKGSDIIAPRNKMSYSELSALGLLLTLIVLPITLGTRKLMETFGPRVD